MGKWAASRLLAWDDKVLAPANSETLRIQSHRKIPRYLLPVLTFGTGMELRIEIKNGVGHNNLALERQFQWSVHQILRLMDLAKVTVRLILAQPSVSI